MKICVLILIILCVASTTSVTLTGKYVNLETFQNQKLKFTLKVEGVVVDEPDDYTVSINAENSFQSTNVQCLMMDYNNMKYLPVNYTRFFLSIEFLIVRNAHVKYITKADFSGLQILTHVDFQDNEIEHLPGNLFQGVSKTLTTVSFMNNKITNVGPNLIANLPDLELLLMSGNPCINMNSPATFKTFTSMFIAKCQKSIIPEVLTDRSLTSEDYKQLNATTNDLIDKNTNLTDEIKLLVKTNNILKNSIKAKNKLSLDLNKCKLSSAKLQTELTNAKNILQLNVKNKPTIDNLNKTLNN